MLEEVASIKSVVAKSRSDPASSYKTPPPKVAAPSPENVKGKKLDKPPPHPVDSLRGPPAASIPTTEAAKLQRLRRLCEKKPSGKCNVNEDIHLRWKTGAKADREAMIEELESVEWSKEPQYS